MKLILHSFLIVFLIFDYAKSALRNQCNPYNIPEMVRQLGEPSLNGRGQKIFVPPISIQSCIYISTTELRNSRPFYQNLIRDNNGMIRRASLLEQNDINRFRQQVNAFIMSGGNVCAAASVDQRDLNGYGGGGPYGAGCNNLPNNAEYPGQYGQYGAYSGDSSYAGPYDVAKTGYGGQYRRINDQYGNNYASNNGFTNGAFLRPPCFCQDCSAGVVVYTQTQANSFENNGEPGLSTLESNLVIEGSIVTDADNCITYSPSDKPSFSRIFAFSSILFSITFFYM